MAEVVRAQQVDPSIQVSSVAGIDVASPNGMANVLRSGDERTFGIIGAAMEVHREFGGPGLLEVVYRDALKIEFRLRGIPFAAEVPFPIDYKGHRLRGHYRIDFVCFDSIVVEVKARSASGPAEHAQVLNYLKVSGHRVGLLLNFGAPRLEYRRFVMG
jgi:GxxExxY protein